MQSNMKENAKDNIKDDEIVWELRHKLSLWDYFVNIFFLAPFGCLILYIGISLMAENGFAAFIFAFFGAAGCFFVIYDMFYIRKNRFYITNQGMGFERRHWFKMQKGFFKFGEVGIFFGSGSRKLTTDPNVFILFPFHTQVLDKWYGYVIKSAIKYKIIVIAWNATHSIVDSDDSLFKILINKTEQALKIQGAINLEVKYLESLNGKIIFGKGNTNKPQ